MLAFLSTLHAAALSAQQPRQTGTVAGRILDEQSNQPVAEIVVRVRGTQLATVTNADGRFEIRDVPIGIQILVLQHLAYGERLASAVVQADQTVQVNTRLAQRPIMLDSLVVETMTELDRRRQSTGFSMNEIRREVIDQAAQRGQSLWELLRDAMPQVRVSQQSMGFISCVEFRGGSSLSGACQMMAIFVDGVYMSAPGTIPPNMPLNDIERVEAIGPGQAGVQYGTLGGNGVLLIETRTGPRVQRRPEATDELAGFDWSEELEPYRWMRVGSSAFLANALGLGLGLVAANHCLYAGERGVLTVRESCNALKTIGVAAVAVGLPTLGASYAARWSGTTQRSRGRILPAVIMGSVPALAGYLFLLEGESQGSGAVKNVGLALLTVGTPTFISLSDRLFRALR